MTRSANELNNNLTEISTRAFQWKMNSYPDPTKQAQEVIFSQKIQSTNHPCLIFNHNPVSLTESHKHLGYLLLYLYTYFLPQLKQVLNLL